MSKIEMVLLEQKQVLKDVFLKLVGNILNKYPQNIEHNSVCVGWTDHPGLKNETKKLWFPGSDKCFCPEVIKMWSERLEHYISS